MTAGETPAAPAIRRRSWRRAIVEMHYRLRTEADTPRRQAAAIGLGAFIGCLPIYGAHLPVCVGLARMSGLSRLTAYLGSHVNNPLSAPLILYLEFGIGRLLRSGEWPSLTLAELRARSVWSLGLDLFTGSLVLGLGVGALLGALAYAVNRRARHAPRWIRLLEETSRRYMDCGIFAWEFVRGKLRHDPLYPAVVDLLEREPIRTVVDLGCGRGIVLALLDTARRIDGLDESSAPTMIGVERQAAHASIAQTALGERARIELADLADYTPPAADVVLLLDVLHYLNAETQERLLARSVAALTPGGRLVLRETDAGGGVRYWLTRAGERLAAIGRGAWRQRFRYRSAAEWAALLRIHGIESVTTPAWSGTPFRNVLIEARKPAG